MVFGIVGCAEPPKPEKYGYDWERIFLNENIGISLLCANNNSTVSFLLISEKEDWKNTDEKNYLFNVTCINQWSCHRPNQPL